MTVFKILYVMEEKDDYWNESDVKSIANNFEDDELTSHQFSKLGAEIRADLSNNTSMIDLKSTTQLDEILSLQHIITDQAMDIILLADSGKYPPNYEISNSDLNRFSISRTLKQLILGRPCSLKNHKSLRSKIELLDGAVAIGDGNLILTIVLFLIQTLKKKLVYQILLSRPVAVNHYVNYLTIRMKTHEVTDLLTMLGRSGDAAIKQYQLIMKSSTGSLDALLSKLKYLATNHFSQLVVEPIFLKMLTDYINLLEWQKILEVSEIENKSVIQCLAYCCIHNWSENSGKTGSPFALSQKQQVFDILCPLTFIFQQFDWTALSVQASLKNWNIIETMFVKKNFLGRSTLSCSVSLPKVIARLSEFNADESAIIVYLNQISHLNQRLDLAKKYKVHKIVIDCFVHQKDRQALTQYKMALHPQSDQYFYAENALRVSSTKWKN